MTKAITHYWADQTTAIEGEPQMVDNAGYPFTVAQAKAWCKAKGYDYYVIEAAGDYGTYISEKTPGAILPPGKRVKRWKTYLKEIEDKLDLPF